MKPDIGHYILAAVALLCGTVIVLRGHGDTLVTLAGGAGGLATIVGLFQRSIVTSQDSSQDSKPQ